MSEQFDLTVVGSGPAGYVAAIRAAQLGMKVCLVEGRETNALGGTCLNVGCIPSKALLDSSNRYEEAVHHLGDHGVDVDGVALNLKKMLARKNKVVKTLTDGINMLMKKNKVTVKNGWGSVKDANTVTVKPAKGKAEDVKTKNILLATGSVPVELPFAKFDGKVVVSSTEALDFKKVPEEMIVIGAGVIGLELGSVWRRLGAKVTLVDVAPRPVAMMDEDLGKEATKIFKKQGLAFELGVGVKDISVKKGKAEVTLDNGKVLKGDKVLVSVGRRANTEGLGCDKAGIQLDGKGRIEVLDNFETSLKGVYAVGDCIPGPMLAHKGEEEGVACVENLAGQAGHVNYRAIPWVVYTEPEIAGVGLSEDDAKAGGRDVKIGKFYFRGNGRALAMDEADGFVKIVADAKTDELLGCHIIGANASEMIAEAVTLIEFGGSAEDLARTVHAHPTMSEAVKEAALAVDKRQIHG